MPGNCPVCGEGLTVARLHCPNCDTSIEGHFTLGRLSHLNADQLSFVETFIRCEGTIKRVEKELGISYPTVRSRLEEVIRALGFEIVTDYGGRITEVERGQTLDRLSRGEISTEEALAILRGD
jgi:hypothetical protein